MLDTNNRPARCIVSDALSKSQQTGDDPPPDHLQPRCAGVLSDDLVELYSLCLECDLLHTYGDRTHYSMISSTIAQDHKEAARRKSLVETGCSSIHSMLEMLSIGDPDARVSLPQDIEIFRLLEPLLNRIADFMKQQIEDSHETAIGLCEHYETLLRIAGGDLKQRASVSSRVELIAKLGELINVQSETLLNAITLRAQAEEALRQARDSLEQTVEMRTAELMTAKEAAESANRAKSVFFSKMNHDLRNPLTAILGYSQMMLRDATITDKQRKYLDTISSSGEHLMDLINSALDMSRMDVQQPAAEPVAPDTTSPCKNLQAYGEPTLQQLSGLPQNLLGELRTAVLALDTTETIGVIEKISQQEPAIAAALNKLAQNLDYEGLLSLLDGIH